MIERTPPKKTKPISPKNTPIEPVLVFRFDGGTSGSLPVKEIQLRELRQHAAMAASADLAVRASGLKKLDEAATAIVDARMAPILRSIAAQKTGSYPRPKARSELKKAIFHAMATRGDDQSFQSFIQMWRLGHVRGLTLSRTGEKYVIKDENGELGSQTYTRGTLAKMYSS